MTGKNLKMNVQSTKDLYKAATTLLKELNTHETYESAADAIQVWITTTGLIDYVIEEFMSIADEDDKATFLKTFEEGVNSIPDQIQEQDLIDVGFYNKGNLPKA